MAIPINEHESLINRLLDTDLETTERVQILTDLRENYGSTVSELEETTQIAEKAKEDLNGANSALGQMFREQGIKKADDDEPDPQSFSESITLTDLGI